MTPSSAPLDRVQLGHLRHFDNLSRHLPNDWALMQGKGQGQDDFGSYRFQLAYMASTGCCGSGRTGWTRPVLGEW